MNALLLVNSLKMCIVHMTFCSGNTIKKAMELASPAAQEFRI
jgi:hypothetical protein